jgi:hypothetical protein
MIINHPDVIYQDAGSQQIACGGLCCMSATPVPASCQSFLKRQNRGKQRGNLSTGNRTMMTKSGLSLYIHPA